MYALLLTLGGQLYYLLTGPMFSQLLGNLVLRDLDETMSASDTVTYCRYVDDIILIGSKVNVNAAYQRVEDRLAALKLSLHASESEKHLTVDGKDWLRGEHDFDDSREAVNWMTFIGGLKWLVTSAPKRRSNIQQRLQGEGFRLPVPDYSGAVREANYIALARQLIPLPWFREKRKNVREVITEGRILRDRYIGEIEQLLQQLVDARGYERKRLLPKVRYRVGRLAYLASTMQLTALAAQLRFHHELAFHATVLMSVATGDVTEAIRLGANVVQAVAQPLRADGRRATVQGPLETEIEAHGLAILALNGVRTSGEGIGIHTGNDLVRLACSGSSVEMMRSSQGFLREFASLHGVGAPRHPEMLDSAFILAEDSVFDAVSQAMYLESDW